MTFWTPAEIEEAFAYRREGKSHAWIDRKFRRVNGSTRELVRRMKRAQDPVKLAHHKKTQAAAHARRQAKAYKPSTRPGPKGKPIKVRLDLGVMDLLKAHAEPLQKTLGGALRDLVTKALMDEARVQGVVFREAAE